MNESNVDIYIEPSKTRLLVSFDDDDHDEVFGKKFNLSKLNLTWVAYDVTKTQILIQIYFEDTYEISNTQDGSLDTLIFAIKS